MRLMDKMRNRIRSFLRIENMNDSQITLQNLTDFETSCYRNRVWSWADKEAIEQLYKQLNQNSERMSFWAATPSTGIVKRHTGLPGRMATLLTDIVMTDLNKISVESEREYEWEEMDKEINLKEILSDAVKEIMVVGDGAFRISMDTKLRKYPIVDFVPAEKVEYKVNKGVLQEVIFKELIDYSGNTYMYEEHYGYGCINYKLYKHDKEVPLDTVPYLRDMQPVTFENKFIMAVPFMAFKSTMYKGRGASIFSGKSDSFDSLDEIWSQWMDAVRRGRAKEYIPDDFLPRDASTGEIGKRNQFDNDFIAIQSPMSEGTTKKIELIQPQIPHESYLAAYMTALDLCLQGVMSPSTLGIDVKKMDNAEAQREKEKATLYTRNKVVQAIQESVPKLVDTIFKVWDTYNKKSISDTDVTIEFGEYANPSFESQIETVSKGKSGGIMSCEAAVEELYGDTKDEEWKKEEVARLKAEQGIAEMEEPTVNTELGDFKVNV